MDDGVRAGAAAPAVPEGFHHRARGARAHVRASVERQNEVLRVRQRLLEHRGEAIGGDHIELFWLRSANIQLWIISIIKYNHLNLRLASAKARIADFRRDRARCSYRSIVINCFASCDRINASCCGPSGVDVKKNHQVSGRYIRRVFPQEAPHHGQFRPPVGSRFIIRFAQCIGQEPTARITHAA
jgi:hypothetical protein